MPAATQDRPTTQAGRTPLVVRLLVLATFVVILNETLMINAIPRLMESLHVTEHAAQWVSTAFMLTMAAVIPITGWFLQRVTTRQGYAIAMSVFLAGTALSAVAPTFTVLLLGRIVQAGGAQEAYILQEGSDLMASIVQQGQGNNAAIRQSGSNNSASIEQFGNYNTASIQQSGTGLTSAVTQAVVAFAFCVAFGLFYVRSVAKNRAKG